jgi:hypothetical protein
MIHSRIHALVGFSSRTEGLNLLGIKDWLKLCFVADLFDGGDICTLKLREILWGLLVGHIVCVWLTQAIKYIEIIELLLNWGSIGLSHVLHASVIVHSRLRELAPDVGIFLTKYIILVSLLV